MPLSGLAVDFLVLIKLIKRVPVLELVVLNLGLTKIQFSFPLTIISVKKCKSLNFLIVDENESTIWIIASAICKLFRSVNVMWSFTFRIILWCNIDVNL